MVVCHRRALLAPADEALVDRLGNLEKSQSGRRVSLVSNRRPRSKRRLFLHVVESVDVLDAPGFSFVSFSISWHICRHDVGLL